MPESFDRNTNHLSHARFDDVYRQYHRLRSGLDDVQRRLTDLRVSAESDDGMVHATVGARGELIDLRLDKQVFRELDEVSLSHSIVATVHQATAKSGRQVEELMSAFLPNDASLLSLLSENEPGFLLRLPDSDHATSPG